MRHHGRRNRSIAGLLALMLLGVVAFPAGTSAAPGGPVRPYDAQATPTASRGFRLDLARRGDFVAQTNLVQCVGASMQMMLNIIRPSADRSAGTQRSLQALARSLSGPTREGYERKGASVRGWTAGLNTLDVGDYRMAGYDTLDEAMKAAVWAIRQTGRPVGLLVWSGRHAWVMTGFEANADPSETDNVRVTAAFVLDPLYPHASAKWGRSPTPGVALSVAQLGKQFVPRRRGTWAGAIPGATDTAALAGKYVLVLPDTKLSLWAFWPGSVRVAD